MSQTIENRIVEMQFENKQFESGVQESLSTLDKLKNALKFDDASKNLENFGNNISKNIDLTGITKSVDGLSDRFSTSGIVGMEVIRKLTDFAIEAGKTIAHALDAPFQQIRSGGWKRAMNIEDAKFQLKGLDIAWETVADDINYAVADTAFGLDAAAKACAQLSASSVQAGDDMKAALRGISGVAAMGNTEYENIAQIFTKAAGNGKVMADELNRISQYGLNARASLANFFNDIVEGGEKTKDIPEEVKKRVMTITKGVKVTEGEISEFASKSKIDFETFSYAMDSAFGEHAKKANETFMGSLRNIKAALSKIGAEFATPIIKGAIPVFNEIRVFLNDLRKNMSPVFEVFSKIVGIFSDKLTGALYKFRVSLLDFGAIEHIGNAINNVFTSIVKIIVAVKNAFQTVFPPAHNFGRVVESIAEGIERFSEKLVISDGALLAFRNVMVVVFNILKAIGTVIRNILPIVTKAVTIVLKVVGVIVSLIGYLTTLVMQLDIVKGTMAAIEKAGGLFAYVIEKLKNIFASLRDILTDTSTVTGRFFNTLKEYALTAAYIVGGALYLAFVKIKDVISYFDTHDPLGSLLDSINRFIGVIKELPIIQNVISGIETAFGFITAAVFKTIEAVKTFVTQIHDGKSVFDAFAAAASGAIDTIFVGFSKLIEKVKGLFSDFLGIFTEDKVIEETIETPIANAEKSMVGFVKELSLAETGVKSASTAFEQGRGTLYDYQHQLDNTKTGFEKARGAVSNFAATMVKKIRDIDIGKVILSAYAAILMLIAYNSNELIKALGALTRKLSSGFFNIFKQGTTKLTKFKVAMIAIAGSIATLAGSLYMLKDIPVDQLNAITNSLLKLIGLTGGLSLLATIAVELTTRFGGGNGFNLFSSNMFMLAAGVIAIIGALKLLDKVDMNGIWTKVLVLGAIGAGLTTFSILMGKFAPQLSLGSIFMVAFASSILILVKALDNLSHVDLTGISENWKELSVVIVSFAAFAALAGTVGVSSLFSLLAFLLGLKTLLTNFDTIKEKLEEYEVGAAIAKFCERIKEEIKAAIAYLKDMFDSLDEFDKKAIGWYMGIASGGLFLVLIGLSKAVKYIKKMAISATIFALGVVGVMAAVTKIAQACKSIPQAAIDSALNILGMVAGLFLAVIAISAIFGGETSLDWNKFGKNGKGLKSKLGTRSFKKSGQTEYLKQARKMMIDMAVLLASVALFVNTVGKLKKEELDQAIPILTVVGAVIVALMITITAISSHAKSAGKASASIAAFIGIIGVIGSLLGAFVVLMNYFKNFDITTQWGQLLATMGVMTLIVVAVYELTKAVKIGKQQSAYKSILAFTALLSAIGLLVTYMIKEIPREEMGRAAGIAASLLVFTAVVSGMILALEAFSNKLANTANRRKAFATTMTAIIAMMASFMVVGATLFSMATQMDGWDVARMAAISLVITTTLAALSAIVLAIQHFSKESLTSITKTSGPKLKQTLAMIGMFFLAFEALAITFAAMKNVDPDKMASQMLTITIALTALTTLGLAIQHFVKKMGTDWATIGKSGAILGGMIALFTALGLVFKYIISSIPDPVGVLAKSQILMLCLLEFEVLAVGAGILGGLAADVALGELTLLGMVALFGILTLAFIALDKLKTEGIMKKSQTLVLVLLELEVLALACAVLGGGGALAADIALGELTLLGMVALFGILSMVFIAIDKLKTEGIMKKSQTMILVMLELEALLAVLAVITPLAVVALAGMPGLLGVITALLGIAAAIWLLGDYDMNRIQGTVDIFIDTLKRLMGIGVEGIIAGPGLQSLALGIGALGLACGVAAVSLGLFATAVVALAAAIGKLSSTGPSIMSWFTSISVGVTTLATSIMASIEGLSKSVVRAINNLIAGVVVAITGGGAMIFAAAAALGNKMKEGFESIIKPKLWGADIVSNLASGILSKIGVIANAAYTVAKTIWSYLHFTSPDKGPLADFDTYGPHMMDNLGGGMLSNIGAVLGPVNTIGDKIKNGFSGIDLTQAGQFLSQTFANGIANGSGGIFSQLNGILEAIGLVDNKIANMQKTWSKGSSVMESYYHTLKENASSANREVQRLSDANSRLASSGARAHQGMGAVNTKLQEAKDKAEKANKALSDFENGVQETTESVNDLSKGIGGLESAGGKGAKGVKEAKDAVADFYDMIQGAISLFDKYEEAEEMSTDELLSNMASQISGIANWSTKIQQLATKGIDQGLLQKLAEMGPQGEKYVNAFVNMTAEQLAQANKYYEQSLILPQHVTAQVYGSFAIAGSNAKEGFLNGLEPDKIREDGITFAHNFLDGVENFLGIKSPSTVMRDEVGKNVTAGVEKGITWPTSIHNLNIAVVRVANKILDTFEDTLNEETLSKIGRNVVAGIQKGIEDQGVQNSLFDKVRSLCQKVIQTAKSPQGFWEHSPSKVFHEIGAYVTEGLAKGISDNTEMATRAMGRTSEEIIDQMRDTINKANEALVEDVNEPVITPVLDLSEIENGSRELNNMLSRNQALSTSRSFTNLQNAQWGSQTALLNATADNTDVVTAINSLSEDINTLKDAMTNIKMVLDTGTMVGAMTPAIDQQLGMRQVYAGRGI